MSLPLLLLLLDWYLLGATMPPFDRSELRSPFEFEEDDGLSVRVAVHSNCRWCPCFMAVLDVVLIQRVLHAHPLIAR